LVQYQKYTAITIHLQDIAIRHLNLLIPENHV
jgi:hypothetical protein